MNEKKLIKLSEILDENNQYTIDDKYISLKDETLDFKNISIDKQFQVLQEHKDSTKSYQIRFLNCNFEVTSFLYSLDYKYITFNRCKFNKITHEDGLLSTVGDDIRLWFIDCEFNEIDFTFDEKQPIQLYGFHRLSGKIKTLIIGNAIVDTKLQIHGRVVGDRRVLEIDYLSFQNIDFKDDFELYSTKVNLFNMYHVNFEKKADFLYVHILNSFPEGFTHIEFNNINFKGFTRFVSCIFEQKVVFNSSSFEEYVNFNHVSFNKGLDLDYANIQKNMNFYNVRGLDSQESKVNTTQETYRIIKYNLEKIGNKIEANRYHSLELDNRRKNIWKNGDPLLNRLQDSIVFWVHKLSSNHSMSWVLPLFWIFIVAILTGWLTESLVDFQSFKAYVKYAFSNIFNDFRAIWTGFVSLFPAKYLSIFADIDINKNPWVFVVHKTLLGYLYYQFLVAVRKDTKK